MWRVKDCKIIAGEHVATQHKPLVFVVRMQKMREEKVVGRKTIKWWKCSRDTVGTQWGHSHCIQREVDIRLIETWNNIRQGGRRMECFQRCFCWRSRGAVW